ncbi:MAG: phytoene desaturase family protein [Endomicrobiales bacterium]
MKNIAIIGAGMGGLVAGNLLALKGHKMTIFESHILPGGYTAGFRRNGFYFESGTLTFELSASFFKALRDVGVYDQFTFEKHTYRFITKDYDETPASYEDYKKMILDAYPAQKEAVSRYFREVDRLCYPVRTLSGQASLFKKLLAGAAFGLQVIRFRNQTTSGFAARNFQKGTQLYRTFSGIGYPDSPALALGAALDSIFEDSWTVKEGFQALADALAERFKKNGGTLRLHASVEKILTRDGAAAGVRCKGEDIPADVVISACDYKQTFLKLLDPENVPEKLREKITKAVVSEGFGAVYLGLSISNEELLKKLKRPVVVCDESGRDANVLDPNDASYFEKAAFWAYALSDKHPGLAPEGKSSVMIEARALYHWMNNWGGGDLKKYVELKTGVRDTLIRRFNDLFPGIKDVIEFKDMATPLTFERYTKNTDGATSAWSWNPRKKFYNSMNPMGTFVDTPVKNLFIGSCWATQIGGIPGAISAAYACAKKIERMSNSGHDT